MPSSSSPFRSPDKCLSDQEAYRTSMLREWHPAIVGAAGCHVLARGCHVSQPRVGQKKGGTAWVGYLVVDEEDGLDLRKAYWVVPVKMGFQSTSKSRNDVLREIQQLDDALEHQAEYYAYAALLACPDKAYVGYSSAGAIDTHIVYVSFPCPATDQAASLVTPGILVAKVYHSAFVERFATCRQQDDPNSQASKAAQLMVPLWEKEEDPSPAPDHLTGCPMSVDVLACAGSGLEEGTMWYLRDGIWVNDYLDRHSLGAAGQKITEAESELFALTALHASETVTVYPLPSRVRWAVYIRRSLTPLEIDLALKALDAILSNSFGAKDGRSRSAVTSPRRKKRKIKPNSEPLISKARPKLDVLGQARHEDVSESDSEAEESEIR